jgi:hypothetical protein
MKKYQRRRNERNCHRPFYEGGIDNDSFRPNDDCSMNEDNEKTMDDTLRKRAIIIDVKLKKLKGINNRVHSDFVDKFIP